MRCYIIVNIHIVARFVLDADNLALFIFSNHVLLGIFLNRTAVSGGLKNLCSLGNCGFGSLAFRLFVVTARRHTRCQNQTSGKDCDNSF